ncbi:MAG: molybdopterin molybdotransferase MoeA [Oligoflexia bacterium]|nr:molybdopterin molybdotransferase MoeA [Oligoflexia bacterium]
MITVAEALLTILEGVSNFGTTLKKLEQLNHEILAEDIYSDRAYPPYDRVAMDGIAIKSSAWQAGISSYLCIGVEAAGVAPLSLGECSDHCIEVMTGAVLPDGADAVIPMEELDLTLYQESKKIKVSLPVRAFQNVHRKASDLSSQTLLLAKGEVLNSVAVSVLASVGKADVLVWRRPRIAIIATGSELVAVAESTPLPYQIRVSNSYAIAAALKSIGMAYEDLKLFKLADDPQKIFEELQKIVAADFDFVILSGGVSVGRFDFIPELLTKLGVDTLFRKVAQRPGKPMLYGKVARGEGDSATHFLALPGNPAAAIICCYHYLLPAIKKGMQQKFSKQSIKKYLSCKGSISNNKELTSFVPVREEGQDFVEVQPTNGSGDLFALAKSDGYIILPAKSNYEAKQVVDFVPWGRP